MVGVADTEEDALARVADYFDGDTEGTLGDPAVNGTIYYQTDGDDIVGIWRRESGGWQKLPLRDEVFSSISVGKLAASGASINEAVVEQLWGQLAVFDRVDAREGWIGDVALQDGAVKSRAVDTVEFTASAAFLDNAMVNLIQGRMADFDQALIGGTLLKDKSVSTQKMVVGNYTNLITDPQFSREWGMEGGWQRHDTAEDEIGYFWWSAGDTNIIRPSGGISGEFRVQYGRERLEARPGEKYWFSAKQMNNSNSNHRLGIRVGYLGDHDGVIYQEGRHYWPAGMSTGDTLDYSWTVPEIGSIRTMFILLYFERTTSHIGMYAPTVTQANSGKMVIDGLLQATEAELENLFFNEAVGNKIAAGSAEFLELDADQIRSNSWTGVVATAATFQTHSQSNRGVKLQPKPVCALGTAVETAASTSRPAPATSPQRAPSGPRSTATGSNWRTPQMAVISGSSPAITVQRSSHGPPWAASRWSTTTWVATMTTLPTRSSALSRSGR
ncbi:hypothetical protein [Nesterenkonia pannonica]|uniref:hypothetical protein n=1 Tax=Nesterenkonia pannonica TaxID=1548602 RepID=UPI002164DF71|nr:hypothetical protein [Nesterenkonia pannonica]